MKVNEKRSPVLVIGQTLFHTSPAINSRVDSTNKNEIDRKMRPEGKGQLSQQ